jgi:hypothetical protein
MTTITSAVNAATKKMLTAKELRDTVFAIEQSAYSVPEAAKLSGLDPRTLRSMCRENKVEAVKLHDDVWLLPKAEFDAYCKGRKTKQEERATLEAQMAKLQAEMDALRQGKRVAKG